MTKRFTGEFDKQYSGVHDNGEQLTNFEVVDLLNNLSERNMELEQKIKSIKEILSENIGYIESFRRIEEVLK